MVPYDIVWTPGANWATTLEADRPVRINGVDVAAGAYSVWMTPREGSWTMTLNAETEFFHFQKPDPALATLDRNVGLPDRGVHGVGGGGDFLRRLEVTRGVSVVVHSGERAGGAQVGRDGEWTLATDMWLQR